MCGNMIYMTIVNIRESFVTVLNRKKGEFPISKCSQIPQYLKELTFPKYVMCPLCEHTGTCVQWLVVPNSYWQWQWD